MRLERRKKASRETEHLILRTLHKDSLDWPKGSTRAEIDILLDGIPHHFILEKDKKGTPNWIIKTIM
jgi:hypothetical protein